MALKYPQMRLTGGQPGTNLHRDSEVCLLCLRLRTFVMKASFHFSFKGSIHLDGVLKFYYQVLFKKCTFQNLALTFIGVSRLSWS